MSSATWGTTTSSSAPIARHSIVSTRPSTLIRPARRNARFPTWRRPEIADPEADVTSDRVLIAGAGIGGLTAALALARQGIEVTVFEQAEALQEAGAGIQLSANAVRVLVELGLAERLEPAIVEPTAVRLRAGSSGRDIAIMP